MKRVFLSLDFVKVRRSLIEVRGEFAVMFASILTNRRAESPDFPHFVVCHSVELVRIFFRRRVGHDGNHTNEIVRVGTRPRAGVRLARPTVLGQLLSKFVGLLTKCLSFSAKFREFSRLVPCGRAVWLGGKGGEAQVVRGEVNWFAVGGWEEGAGLMAVNLRGMLGHEGGG